MNRSVKIYIAILVLVLIVIFALDSDKPKPIDWRPSYSIMDKIPLGLYVFNEEKEAILKNQEIQKLNVTPYEYFSPLYDYDTLVKDYQVKGTFLNISEFSEVDEQSIKEICYFVSHGNNAFLSAKIFPDELLDSLKIKMGSEYKMTDSIYNWTANPHLGNQKYKMTEGAGNNYFSKIDTVTTTVLGYQNGDTARVNFIKVNFDNGAFYLHTQPTAFTNFHLLKGNHYQYAEKVLSYIPKGNVYWYSKSETISQSQLRFILSQPALKWAWYIILGGMMVFMIFNAKRKQRVVPINVPLSNTTVDFTKTIGNLYYQEGDHDNIVNKKIIYFLEKIRNEYLMDTSKLDEEFVKKLHQKSGKDLDDIKKAIGLINKYRKSRHGSIEEDLIQINNAIEKIIN